MKGLDRKAILKLEELRASGRLSEKDAELVEKKLADYSKRGNGQPNAGFFTQGERKRLVQLMYDRYFDGSGQPKADSWSSKDRKLRDELQSYLVIDEIPAVDLEFVRSLLETLKNFNEPTPRQRQSLKKMVDHAKNYGFQKDLYKRLKAKLEANDFPMPVSINFVESVLSRFEVRGLWSEIQQEHVEKILANNRDDVDSGPGADDTPFGE